MKTINKSGTSFLISTNPTPLLFLKYQLVFQIDGDSKYLKSFNLLLGNKILKKFYLNSLVLFDDKINIEEIIYNKILNEPEVKTENLKGSKSPKNKIDPKARSKAASELFSNFGM